MTMKTICKIGGGLVNSHFRVFYGFCFAYYVRYVRINYSNIGGHADLRCSAVFCSYNFAKFLASPPVMLCHEH